MLWDFSKWPEYRGNHRLQLLSVFWYHDHTHCYLAVTSYATLIIILTAPIIKHYPDWHEQ